MATSTYNQYPGDAPISPTPSYGSYGYAGDAPISPASSYGYESPAPAGNSWERPQSPVSTIDQYDDATSSALMSSPGSTGSAKQLRDAAIARHREKKAGKKALGMMEVQHSGVSHEQVQKLSSRQMRDRKIAQHHEKKTNRLSLPKMATSSRKRKEKKEAKAYRDQYEQEQEKAAEKRALKILTVYETEEGFQVI